MSNPNRIRIAVTDQQLDAQERYLESAHRREVAAALESRRRPGRDTLVQAPPTMAELAAEAHARLRGSD